MKSDRQLQEDVLAELAYEQSVNSAHIGVTAKDGVVTLSGFVKTFSEKRGAETATKRVAGVRGIAEELKVEMPLLHRRNDADIARAALHALEWDVSIPRDKIQVQVESGWLTLSGEVEYFYQKLNAEEDMGRLAGVGGVSNKMTINPPVSTVAVKNEIEKEFKRHAAIDASHIQVEAQGGIVTLKGKVPSWGEREEAVHAALLAAGVTDVIDNLSIG